jgi:hypothetical protein
MWVEVWDDIEQETLFDEPIKRKKEGWKLAQDFLKKWKPHQLKNVRIMIYKQEKDGTSEIIEGCTPAELGLG